MPDQFLHRTSNKVTTVKKVTKVKSLCVEALQRRACRVERSETSLICHFQALPKKQLEILRLAQNDNDV